MCLKLFNHFFMACKPKSSLEKQFITSKGDNADEGDFQRFPCGFHSGQEVVNLL